jgi:hypothetical protein
MRVRPEIRPYLIASRMTRWLDIVRCPLVDIRVPTWKARKNYQNLVRRYPAIATALGYTEALSFPSPLHGLWAPVQQEERQPSPPAPRQEFPSGSLHTDVTSPTPAQRFGEQITGSQPEPPGVRRAAVISLAEEVL